MQKTTIILFILLILVMGYVIGLYVRIGLPWSGNATIITIITLAGAFGGLLYTARESGFEFPHRSPENEHKINLGWVADCAYGIAGAYVIFLILPTELNSSQPTKGSFLIEGSLLNTIKLVAFSLVGGYGGRSLVDRALANLVKDVEQAKEKAQEAKDKLNQIQEVDTKALELVNRHLEEHEGVTDIQLLKESIKAASRAARFEIFKEASNVRSQNWKDNVPLMERTIPIFEALIENNAREEFHRNHAQLGYALKDQRDKDWKRAYQELTKAIKLRDQEGEEGFLMYEFNRAMCGITLGKEPETIIRDIEVAAQSNYLHQKMKDIDLITNWTDKHSYNLESLEKMRDN